MYVSFKVLCLKLFISTALSLVIPLVIPEVFCLFMWSPPHGLVGSTGR